MIVAGYELLGRVSASDRGGVWQARDTGLDRLVAIKEMTGRGAIAALRAEARVLAGLHDEHIVTVYDLVEQDGAGYLIEEWINGASLAALLATRPDLTAGQGLAVLRGALLGLATAHRQGVVHGDVSPANILLDITRTTKLVDFGLGGHAGTGSAGSSGTSGYTAPEVESGGMRTARSDVYSVGAVLRSLIGSSAVAPHFSGVLDRATDNDPDQRFPDAGAFLTALVDAADRVLGAGWWQHVGLAGLVTAVTTGTLRAADATPSGTAQGAPGVESVDAVARRPARRLTRNGRLWAATGVVTLVAATAIVITAARNDAPTGAAASTTPSGATTATDATTVARVSDQPTKSSPPGTTSSAAEPSPGTSATPTGFNGTYTGVETITALDGPWSDTIHVGDQFGPITVEASTRCTAGACSATLDFSGTLDVFTTTDQTTWTMHPTDSTLDCFTAGEYTATVPTQVTFILTTTASKQGRVTGVRGVLVSTPTERCPDFDELPVRTDTFDLSLTS